MMRSHAHAVRVVRTAREVRFVEDLHGQKVPTAVGPALLVWTYRRRHLLHEGLALCLGFCSLLR